MTEDNREQEMSPQQASQQVGILGFNTATDALRDTDIGRTYYVDDREIRWVSPPGATYQDVWGSSTTMDPEKFVSAFADSPEQLEVIDRRVFNYLRSGPLKEVSRAHDGIAWGIAIMCGRKIKRDARIYGRTLEAVPGVGPKLSSQIVSNLGSYPAPELEQQSTDSEGTNDGR
jgi:hypothetical protein